MAPTSEHGTPPSFTHSVSLWDLIDSLFKHPGVLFGASTLILGIFAAKSMQHSTKRQHEQWEPLPSASRPVDEKNVYDDSTLSDLPPPLRSVLTSDMLTEGLGQSQQRLIPSDPLPYQRQYIPVSPSTSPSKPWRRHSYPSPLDTDPPSTAIRRDETSYYPIIDDDGNPKPGRWRRRTLVFEMLPAADTALAAAAPNLHDVLNGVTAESSLKRDRDDAGPTSGSSKKARGDTANAAIGSI